MVQNKGDVRYLLRLKDYDTLPEVEQEELLDVWYDIYKEYSDIAGSKKADMALLKEKRLAAMRHMYNYHTILLNAVANLPIPEMVELVNEEGFKIDLKDFDRTWKAARSKLLKKKAQIELEENNNTEDDQGADFDSLIVAMEKEQGYGFNQKEMTVRHFANIYKNYKDGQRKNKKK